MNRKQKHNCSNEYNQELKDEIIARSNHIKYVQSHNMPLAAFCASLAFICIVLAILFCGWSDAPILFTLFVAAPIPTMLGFSQMYYKEYHEVTAKDNSETHRLAQCFREEKMSKRSYCLQSLKRQYAHG